MEKNLLIVKNRNNLRWVICIPGVGLASMTFEFDTKEEKFLALQLLDKNNQAIIQSKEVMQICQESVQDAIFHALTDERQASQLVFY